jgi:uncharacterized protein with WD repeat
MIENLTNSGDKITWKFQGNTIELDIKDAFFASTDSTEKYVYIEAGKDFQSDRSYYFEPNGQLHFFHDENQGKISWEFKGVKNNIYDIGEINVGYYPEKERIIILNISNALIKGYNLEGELLFSVPEPKGYKMQYSSILEERLLVVCDKEEGTVDQYGRFRVNFYIDSISGELEKGNIAY